MSSKAREDHGLTLPGWVLAIFLGMAAVVPVGVYFSATLFFPPDQSYTYVGQGTYHGAPGPIAGAGIPALLMAGGYWLFRRRRRKAD
jgi:LPXTG-motif cell wall-anchored protein